jgi:hypothetical protein
VIRRALGRVLLVVGLVHVVELLLAVWLWRHRRAVLAALAEAAAELGRRAPGTGEGVPGARPTSKQSADPPLGWWPRVPE